MTDTVQRYNHPARWFHALVYLAVLVLLATGWWFVAGGYARHSPLAAVTGLPDSAIHEYAGFAMIAVIVPGLVLGARGAATFVRESVAPIVATNLRRRPPWNPRP
jgi:formate dehydrogenase subunit gamma